MDLQEMQHPDGKIEQVFSDGRRTVIFGNGTCKHQFPDGHTTIRFTNQDIKRFFPDGKPSSLETTGAATLSRCMQAGLDRLRCFSIAMHVSAQRVSRGAFTFRLISVFYPIFVASAKIVCSMSYTAIMQAS